MPREKKPVHRVQMTEGKRNIIHQLLEDDRFQKQSKIFMVLKHQKALYQTLQIRSFHRLKTGRIDL